MKRALIAVIQLYLLIPSRARYTWTRTHTRGSARAGLAAVREAGGGWEALLAFCYYALPESWEKFD